MTTFPCSGFSQSRQFFSISDNDLKGRKKATIHDVRGGQEEHNEAFVHANHLLADEFVPKFEEGNFRHRKEQEKGTLHMLDSVQVSNEHWIVEVKNDVKSSKAGLEDIANEKLYVQLG